MVKEEKEELVRVEGTHPLTSFWVDIFEDGDDLIARAELPGMKKEDIEVLITEETIKICGEKRKEEEIDEKYYHKWERSFGSFCRVFTLPAKINIDKVKSTLKDGVLEIKMHRSKKEKNKEVKIKVE
ncbi:MAG: Hsp20/alpha crystallin family protein [Syntrophaceae bacterium]|nr:Hsp20/alpha crystallin family protein [Syntrophaceae bacterium]